MNNDEWIDFFVEYDYDTDDLNKIKKAKREWKKAVKLYLSDMRKAIWNNPEMLILMPRGYGKTESVLALFIRWFIEIRKVLYIVSPSGSHSRKVLERMIYALKSDKIRMFYGDIMGKTSFDKELMYMKYPQSISWIHLDQPIMLVTWKNAKEGVHPSWIHFEDAQQVSFKNRDSNDDVRAKYNKTFQKMRTRRAGQITKVTATGTRYDEDDFYNFLIDVRKFKLFLRAALEDDNKTWLYSPNYTLEDLQLDKKIDLWSFETNMNNNPLSKGAKHFKTHWWKTCEPWQFVGPKYLAFDGSIGLESGKKNDYACILVVGIWEKKIYVIDSWMEQNQTVIEQVEAIIKYAKKHNTLINYVESNFAQNQIRYIANMYVPNIHRVDQSINKILRIETLASPYSNDMIIYFKNLIHLHLLSKEFNQFDQTESTVSKKDDGLDTLATLWMKLRYKIFRAKKIAMSR